MTKRRHTKSHAPHAALDAVAAPPGAYIDRLIAEQIRAIDNDLSTLEPILLRDGRHDMVRKIRETQLCTAAALKRILRKGNPTGSA